MPATDIERLIIQLEANSSKLDATLDKANKLVDTSMNRIERRTTAMAEAVARQFTTLGGSVLGLFSVERLIRFGDEIVKNVAKLSEQAQQLQISTEAMQAYHIAFEEAGARAEIADVAIGRLNKTIGEAVAGSSQARRFFEQLGLSFEELQHARPDERLGLVAKALLNIGDGTKRAALETQAFGRSGREIESVLPTLARGIDELTQKYKEQGRIISDEVAKKTDEAVDRIVAAWERVKAATTPALASIATGIANLMTNLAGLPPSIDQLRGRLEAARKFAELNKGSILPFVEADASNRVQLLEQQFASALHARAQAAGIPLAGPSAGKTIPAAGPLDQLLAKMKLNAELAGESTEQRSQDEKLIEAAVAKLNEEGKSAEILLDSMKKVNEVLGTQLANTVKLLNADQEREAMWAAFEERRSKSRASANANGGIPDEGILAKTKKDNLEAIDILSKQNIAGEKRAATRGTALYELNEEVRLVGLLPREREQEVELLRLKERFGVDFVNSNEQEIRGLIIQRQNMQDLEGLRETAISQLSDIGAAALTGAGNVKQAFAQMVLSLTQYILKLEIAKALEASMGTGTGAAGGGGDIFSGLLSFIGLGHAAGGGKISGPTIVGENGPEIFDPGTSGYVIPNGALRGGSSSPVNLVVEASPFFDVRVRTTADVSSRSAIQNYDRSVLPSRIQRITRDPRMLG